MKSKPKKLMVELLKNLLEKLFRAKTIFDGEKLKLTASVPVGLGGEMNLMFWEDVDGAPVLVLNVPPLPWGVDEEVLVLLKELLEWRYGELPKSVKYGSAAFRGHKFYGWKPNDFNLMYVYLWDKTGWSEARLNELILKGETK